ncbi:fibronectin type III domain-containing protein [Aquimarina aggregata]|uniref:fibronectin type III domain-containing protein n=1 Tax=Aquimarina aggregata TaxID=1642818 RepID=UPI0024931AB4|nr:fibronectin type III domain-containing protein [Aquimarina aggregata]
MKQIHLLLAFFFLAFIISCSKDDEAVNDPLELEPELTNLPISPENISHTIIALDWETVKADNNVKVTYDIYLEGVKIKEGNEDTDFTLTGLESDTDYTGEIIANSSGEKSKSKTRLEKIPFSAKTKKYKNPDAPVPSDFLIEVTNITLVTATLQWEAATITDNSEIRYDVYLEGDKVLENSTSTRLSLPLLNNNTEYTGEIIAISSNEKTKNIGFSFKTKKSNNLSTEPSDFTVDIEFVRDDFARAIWKRPDFGNDEEILYDVYLGDEKVLENNTDTRQRLNIQLRDLMPNTSYSGRVVAKNNGTSKTGHFSFITPETITLSDITISIDNITSNSARINWTPAIASDNSEVSYKLLGIIAADNITDTFFQANDLRPSTRYVITIRATAGNAYEANQFVQKEFTTLADPSDNPDISFPLSHIGRGVIEWVPAIAPDGQDFTYNIYEGSRLIEANLPGTTSTFNNIVPVDEFGEFTIESYGVYNVEVEAVFSDGSIVIEKLNFVIYPPIPDPVENISVENITATTATVIWDPSYTSDGRTIYYNVYLDGNPVTNMYTYFETSYTFENLTPNTFYNVTVEAVSDGGSSDPVDISFSTSQAIILSDFNINIIDITTEKATLTWTSSTTTDNSEVLYNIIVNGYVERNQVSGNSFLLNNLCPGETYSISITATTASGGTSNPILETFNTTTVIDNPSIVFPLSITPQFGGSQFQIVWTTPIAPNGEDFFYNIYVDNRLSRVNIPGIASNFTMNAVSNGVILESGEHNLKMIAFFSDGTTATEEQVFIL